MHIASSHLRSNRVTVTYLRCSREWGFFGFQSPPKIPPPPPPCRDRLNISISRDGYHNHLTLIQFHSYFSTVKKITIHEFTILILSFSVVLICRGSCCLYSLTIRTTDGQDGGRARPLAGSTARSCSCRMCMPCFALRDYTSVSIRLFYTLVLERAPSTDEFNFQKSSLDGVLSKRGVENKRSEVLYQAQSGPGSTPPLLLGRSLGWRGLKSRKYEGETMMGCSKTSKSWFDVVFGFA